MQVLFLKQLHLNHLHSERHMPVHLMLSLTLWHVCHLSGTDFHIQLKTLQLPS